MSKNSNELDLCSQLSTICGYIKIHKRQANVNSELKLMLFPGKSGQVATKIKTTPIPTRPPDNAATASINS